MTALVKPGEAEAPDLLPLRFERWANDTPDAVAVSCASESLTYASLNERANRIASELVHAGIAAGAPVAVMVEPSVELIVALLGVAKSGAAFVPLDPAYPDDRLEAISKQVTPAAIVASAGMRSRAGLHAELIVLADQPDSVPARHGTADYARELSPGDLAYVMFTSGSSGQPKGVAVSHGNIAGLFEAVQQQLGFGPCDRWSAMHSFAFGFSVWEIWGALTTGAELRLIPDSMRGDPLQWSREIVERQISVLSITPSAFRQWLSGNRLPDPAELRALKLIVFSGEAVRRDDLEEWFERYGDSGPRLVNTYALTETAGRVTTCVYTADALPESGDIGLPTADAEIFLLDPGTGRAAGPGEAGELYIAGPMVAQGYFNEPGLTAERFVEIDPGDGVVRRCYRTGDLARRGAGGALQFAGRADDQVKLRGYRIELQDIENALRQHPRVADAAVVVSERGAAPQLVAWVKPATGEAALEFWPSLGEYQVYDDLLYDFMSADEVRVASYARAFATCVQGKVVLDIGTGKDAILARLCAAAGARKVYAVEVLEDAARKARALIEELGLADRIEVLQGDMQSLELPEAVDVCTQGIVGNIGSSDGIASIWNDARRLFADECIAVPSRCETLIAPAELPSGARSSAAFGPLAARYARQIFASHAQPFDIRLCVRNFPHDGVLGRPAVFENLDFGGPLPTEYSGEHCFLVERDGCFDGFVLWTRICNGQQETVDFLEHQQAWLPVWFPVADKPVSVVAGQRIEARWQCRTPDGQIFPDYEIEVCITDGERRGEKMTYSSRHFEDAYCGTALHTQLHAALESADEERDDADLRDWAAKRLPAHMLPARWEFIRELPLNGSGKLDRRALAAMSGPQPLAVIEADEGVESLLERDIAAIWCSVLELDAIAPHQDFFAAGGDSILAVRLTTEVQRYLDDTVFLAALFDAPTVSSYAAWLETHHAEAVARRLHAGVTKPADDHAAGGSAQDAGRAPDAPEALPGALSSIQQSLWFMHQLNPENTGANEQFLVRVEGGIDPQRMRAAWHSVLRRHEILRACFSSVAGVPRQGIATLEECVANADTRVFDLSALSREAGEERLRADAGQAIRVPFDLGKPPLLRTAIYVMPDGAHVLLVTAHHIIADGLCVELIRDELARACVQPDQPYPQYQYVDFIAAQSKELTAAGVEKELDWWRQTLAGHDGQPAAVAGDSWSAQAPERRLAFEIPAHLAGRLRELAEAESTTLFTVLLAAWRIWLQRCLGNKDLLIGTPVTLRRDRRTADMLGCLVNNVALRNPVDPGCAFRAALRAERDAALAALDHSRVPFDRVLEAVDPHRFPGRHPLFQLMFQFADRSVPPVETAGLRFSVDVLPVDRSSYWDLELSVSDLGRGRPLSAFLGVREDLFDAHSLVTWPEGLLAMLDALAADAEAPTESLPMLSDRQRRVMLYDWNATSMPVTASQTLHGEFARQAQQAPERPAVIDVDETLSYADLDARANRFAASLAACGVGPGDRVGLCTGRSANSIALILAVLKRGAAWLPLDPDYPGERLQQMVDDARPALIVTDRGTSLRAPNTVVADELLGAADSSGPAIPVDTTAADEAFVLFTSGSTGRPKGVAGTHAGAVSRCIWMWRACEFKSSDVFAQRTSLNFVDSIWEMFGALMHGASVAVLPAANQHDPGGLVAWCVRQRVTHLVTVPVLLNAILAADGSEQLGDCLHTVICSGESLTPELARRFHSRLPGSRLLNTYGTSETWDATWCEVPRHTAGAAVPAGKPVANARVYVLDDNRRPVPCGVIGQVYVGGMAVAKGYLRDAELTRSKFFADPFTDAGETLYATGDRGRFRADGELWLEGRADRQFKLRGLRIEAAEIEQVAQGFPGVERAVVLLRGSGGEDAWLGLYVVAAAESGVDGDGLRRYLSALLPRAMVPAQITLLDAMPLTPNGKIDLQSLADMRDTADAGRAYQAPRNETEERLVAIWREALGVERIGVHDDFFALRGHSLMATRMIARICDAFAVELPLRCLFDSPTIAGVAESLQALQWTQNGSVAPDDKAAGEREVLRL